VIYIVTLSRCDGRSELLQRRVSADSKSQAKREAALAVHATGQKGYVAVSAKLATFAP
jgi:hypothetical protein